MAFLAGNFEADVTEALSRDNGLLTFATDDDFSEFHRSPPQLCHKRVGLHYISIFKSWRCKCRVYFDYQTENSLNDRDRDELRLANVRNKDG